MLQFSVFLTFLLVSVIRAPFAAAARLPSSLQSSPRTVYQFGEGTWLENIAVRSNGNLLVTLIDRPELYQIDPFHNTTTLVTNLEDEADALSLLGITEMAPDVFVVIAGNFSYTRAQSDPASYSAWQIDFNRGGKCDKISEIEELPEAAFLNGMTALDRKRGTVLISDSVLGLVWSLNIWTGKFEVVLEDDSMKPELNFIPVLGINGIQRYKNYLYYVNASKAKFYRVRINDATGKATGPYELLATDVPGDDFAISRDGVVYISLNAANSLERVNIDGTTSLIAGGLNSTEIPGATAAAFGRTWMDKDLLYVTTAGGLGFPVNGTYTEGGKVVSFRV